MLLTSTAQTTFGMIITKTDSIINTFTPVHAIINDLIIGKSVEHPFGEDYVIPDDISFDFTVELGASYSGQMVKTSAGELTADENGVITVSVKPGSSFAVKDLEEGTTVKVTEIQKESSGFSVNDGVASKEITVTADGNAILDFVNVYSPAPVQPTNVTVGGTKILDGRQWQEGDSFTFLLEQENADGSYISLGTKTVSYDANDPDFNVFDFSDVFSALSFDSVGTYSFRMTELAGSLSYVDYDETINTFAVKVTDVDMDGSLEINNILASQNAKVAESDGIFNVNVTFNNSYVPPVVPQPGEVAIAVTVNKTVKNTGSATIGPEGFSFILENASTGEKKSLRTDSNGKAVFNIIFGSADIGSTYDYKLYEIDDSKQGITYDKKVYSISVSVILGPDNLPHTEVKIDGVVTGNCVASFENTYNSSAPQIPSKPSSPNQGGAPQTGKSNVVFWMIVMLVSGSLFIVLLKLDRRYSKRVM